MINEQFMVVIRKLKRCQARHPLYEHKSKWLIAKTIRKLQKAHLLPVRVHIDQQRFVESSLKTMRDDCLITDREYGDCLEFVAEGFELLATAK